MKNYFDLNKIKEVAQKQFESEKNEYNTIEEIETRLNELKQTIRDMNKYKEEGKLENYVLPPFIEKGHEEYLVEDKYKLHHALWLLENNMANGFYELKEISIFKEPLYIAYKQFYLLKPYLESKLKELYSDTQKEENFKFESFQELYNYAKRKCLLFDVVIETIPSNKAHETVTHELYKELFINWLIENKGLEQGNEKQFNDFLTVEHFEEFLQFRHNKTLKAEQEAEEKKELVYLYKNNKQQIPFSEFMEHLGVWVNHTHNFEKLKQKRNELFEVKKQEFINVQKFNGVVTTDLDLNMFYVAWLKSELEVIKQWLSDTYPNGEKKRVKTSTVEQIEILKYESYLNAEIENTSNILNNPEPQPEQQTFKTFSDLFTVENHEKYINVLIECEPPLLKKVKNRYEFIGNKKTETGCVAYWFKELKIKGIINASANRNDIAFVLNNEIDNYSVSGATIDNKSTKYETVYEKKLQQLLKNIN